jgi:hypothetical protein
MSGTRIATSSNSTPPSTSKVSQRPADFLPAYFNSSFFLHVFDGIEQKNGTLDHPDGYGLYKEVKLVLLFVFKYLDTCSEGKCWRDSAKRNTLLSYANNLLKMDFSLTTAPVKSVSVQFNNFYQESLVNSYLDWEKFINYIRVTDTKIELSSLLHAHDFVETLLCADNYGTPCPVLTNKEIANRHLLFLDNYMERIQFKNVFIQPAIIKQNKACISAADDSTVLNLTWAYFSNTQNALLIVRQFINSIRADAYDNNPKTQLTQSQKKAALQIRFENNPQDGEISFQLSAEMGAQTMKAYIDEDGMQDRLESVTSNHQALDSEFMKMGNDFVNVLSLLSYQIDLIEDKTYPASIHQMMAEVDVKFPQKMSLNDKTQKMIAAAITSIESTSKEAQANLTQWEQQKRKHINAAIAATPGVSLAGNTTSSKPKDPVKLNLVQKPVDNAELEDFQDRYVHVDDNAHGLLTRFNQLLSSSILSDRQFIKTKEQVDKLKERLDDALIVLDCFQDHIDACKTHNEFQLIQAKLDKTERSLPGISKELVKYETKINKLLQKSEKTSKSVESDAEDEQIDEADDISALVKIMSLSRDASPRTPAKPVAKVRLPLVASPQNTPPPQRLPMKRSTSLPISSSNSTNQITRAFKKNVHQSKAKIAVEIPPVGLQRIQAALTKGTEHKLTKPIVPEQKNVAQSVLLSSASPSPSPSPSPSFPPVPIPATLVMSVPAPQQQPHLPLQVQLLSSPAPQQQQQVTTPIVHTHPGHIYLGAFDDRQLNAGFNSLIKQLERQSHSCPPEFQDQSHRQRSPLLFQAQAQRQSSPLLLQAEHLSQRQSSPFLSQAPSQPIPMGAFDGQFFNRGFHVTATETSNYIVAGSLFSFRS